MKKENIKIFDNNKLKKMRTIKIYLSKFFVLFWVNKNHSFAKNIDDMRTKDFDQ